MSIFYIWNPTVAERRPATIEFVITRGDAFSVNKGTKKFFAEIFAELGIEQKVKDWQVRKYRSKYYTDFLGEDDWRDNWQFVWHAAVTATGKIKGLPDLTGPWIGVDETDSTWKTAQDDDDETVGCLVVADFDRKKDLKKVEDAILEDKKVREWQKTYDVAEPQFGHADMMGLYRQLQIDLGDFKGEFFADGADYAEHVMDLCRKAKGTVHFAERAE